MSYLRTKGFLTRTEHQLIHYSDLCDDIRDHIPFEQRYIYVKYRDRFAKLHEAHRRFLQLPRWKQNLIRLYSKIRDLL